MANSSYYPIRKYSIQNETDSGSVDPRVEEATFYPWTREVIPPGNGTPFGAVFLVVNAALGAGLLSFPLAFYQAGGYWEGIAIELALLVFVILGVMVLAYGAEKKQKMTYEDTVEAVCGRWAKIIAEVCLLAFCFGSNITYLVIIGDQLEDMTKAVIQYKNETSVFYHHDVSVWYIDRRFMLTILALVCILPWLFFKKINILTYTSFLGVLCCFYITAVVTALYFRKEGENCNTSSQCSQSWPDVINAIPFICFGYQCHVSSIPVYVGLKKRNLKQFFVIVSMAVLICFVVYTFTGTFGYLTFHPHTCIESDIIRNYCPENVPIDVARGLLAVVIVTSYPILTFCGRTPLDSLIMKLLHCCRLSSRIEMYKWTRLRIESVVWFLLTLVLALFVEQISKVVSLTGGLAATFIFLFPGMMIIRFAFDSKDWSRLKKILLVLYACCIIIVGSFIFGNSVAYTVMHDIGIF